MRGPMLTFSNTLATLSLFVSLSSLAASVYFNFFWQRELLSVSYRVDDITRTSTAEFGISFAFSNLGKQSAVVQEIAIVRMHSRELSECNKTMPYTLSTPGQIEARSHGGTIMEPEKLVLDSKELSGASFVVEPGNQRVLSARFHQELIAFDSKKQMTIAYCVKVSVLDRRGKRYSYLLEGWQLSGDASLVRVDYSEYFQEPVQLLPVIRPVLPEPPRLGSYGDIIMHTTK